MATDLEEILITQILFAMPSAKQAELTANKAMTRNELVYEHLRCVAQNFNSRTVLVRIHVPILIKDQPKEVQRGYSKVPHQLCLKDCQDHNQL